MSRRLYFLAVGIIAERLINEDFYARATKTVKGWRILLIHHCVVPLPSQGKANVKSKFDFSTVFVFNVLKSAKFKSASSSVTRKLVPPSPALGKANAKRYLTKFVETKGFYGLK